MEKLLNTNQENIDNIIGTARNIAVKLGYEPNHGIIIHILELQLQNYNQEKRSISNLDRRQTVSALKKVKSELSLSKKTDGLLEELGYNNSARWKTFSW